jgi:hypothetical protein
VKRRKQRNARCQTKLGLVHRLNKPFKGNWVSLSSMRELNLTYRTAVG